MNFKLSVRYVVYFTVANYTYIFMNGSIWVVLYLILVKLIELKYIVKFETSQMSQACLCINDTGIQHYCLPSSL